jgi:hypothetical protein
MHLTISGKDGNCNLLAKESRTWVTPLKDGSPSAFDLMQTEQGRQDDFIEAEIRQDIMKECRRTTNPRTSGRS